LGDLTEEQRSRAAREITDVAEDYLMNRAIEEASPRGKDVLHWLNEFSQTIRQAAQLLLELDDATIRELHRGDPLLVATARNPDEPEELRMLREEACVCELPIQAYQGPSIGPEGER
jgi:hypothetical protein